MNYFTLHNILKVVVIGFISIATATSQSLTYYVDASDGSDQNSGLDSSLAWKSLEKVNSMLFQPGDSILLKSGQEWTGQLSIKGSGTLQNPIVVGSYSLGNLPVIHGNGLVTDVVYLFNQEYVTISNLEVTNNVSAIDTTLRRGVHVVGQDFGTLHNIKLVNLYIHDVRGAITLKEAGGIYCEIKGYSTMTNFDSLIIESCRIVDCDRTGISNESTWATRTLTSNVNWYPSTNYIFRNNWVERSGGNGLITRVAVNPLIEYNVFKQCGLTTSGNAMFVFNCDDALVQFNESYLTVYNAGDSDASGFDADYRCKRSVFQYNYSHDNDDGFMVVTCQGGTGRFNDGTIVRYNISQNDGGRGSTSGGIIYLSGQTTNTTIYNNVIYSGANNSLKRIVYHNSWSAYPDSTNYFNNIFYILKNPSATAYNLSQSTNNVFDYNIYYGVHPSSEPTSAVDTNKLTSNPLFVNPGSASIGINTVDGYKITSNSPAINSGKKLNGHAQNDFWGNFVPDLSELVDRGAHEFNSTPNNLEDNNDMLMDFNLFQNYPNPFNPVTKISYSIPSNGFIKAEVYDLLGRKLQVLRNEYQTSGYHDLYWNGSSENGGQVPSGVYFCRLQFEKSTKSIKMVMIH